jgi:hypothetical protein
LAAPGIATAQSVDEQIAAAVLAAPESLRDAATVITRDAHGHPSVIRQGTNALVCEPDGPPPEFMVQCFHESLQGFSDLITSRGAAGTLFDGAFSEAEQAQLSEISQGAIRYALSGPTQDQAVRYRTIMMPYATTASTGLPTDELIDGSPWLMWPGTPAAHYMFAGRPPGAPLEYPFQ